MQIFMGNYFTGRNKLRKLLELTIILLTSLNLSGQGNIFLLGGINISNFNSILFGKEYFTKYNSYYKYTYLSNFGVGLSFEKNCFIYSTSISYSNRGFRNYDVPLKFFKVGEYFLEYNSYLELPFTVSYSYFNKKFEAGLGLVAHKILNK